MTRVLVLALLMLSPLALADDVIFPAQVAGLETGNKTLVIVAPDAAKGAVGQQAWAALSLNIGTVTGLRAVFIPIHHGNMSIGVEGIYGATINQVAGGREAFGGGVRAAFTVADDGDNDALVLAPGIDVIFASGAPGRGLAEYSSYGDVYFVGTSLDVSWVHQFASHFGFELGARLGGAVVVNDGNPKRADVPSIQGSVVPELSLFTGVRF